MIMAAAASAMAGGSSRKKRRPMAARIRPNWSCRRLRPSSSRRNGGRVETTRAGPEPQTGQPRFCCENHHDFSEKSIMSHRVDTGLPYPLGATWDGSGVNFALFSANAEKVELCLFDPGGRRQIEAIPLPEQTHEVWHGYLPDISPGQLYGYRVYGPYEPSQGHRFNPHKLLLDS